MGARIRFPHFVALRRGVQSWAVACETETAFRFAFPKKAHGSFLMRPPPLYPADMWNGSLYVFDSRMAVRPGE